MNQDEVTVAELPSSVEEEIEQTSESPEREGHFEDKIIEIRNSVQNIDQLIAARVEMIKKVLEMINSNDEAELAIDPSKVESVRLSLERLQAELRQPGQAEDSIKRIYEFELGLIELSGQAASCAHRITELGANLEAANLSRSEHQDNLYQLRSQRFLQRTLSRRKITEMQSFIRDNEGTISQTNTELEQLRATQEKISQLISELRSEAMEMTAEAALATATEITDKASPILDTLSSPQIAAHLTDQMIDTVIIPELENNDDFKNIDGKDKSEYLDLVRFFAANRSIEFGAGEDKEKNLEDKRGRLQELESKYYRLSNLATQIDVNLDMRSIPNEKYRRQFSYFTRQFVTTKLRTLMDEISMSADAPDLVVKVRSRVEEILKPEYDWQRYTQPETYDLNSVPKKDMELDAEFARWPYVRDAVVQSGMLAGKECDDLEEILIRRASLEVLGPGGYESWEGTAAMVAMREMKNPIAIPYILQHIEKYGSGHTDVAAFHVMESLLKDCDPDEVKAVIGSMDEQDQRLLSAMYTDGTFIHDISERCQDYTICTMIKERDVCLIMQDVVTKLIEAGEIQEEPNENTLRDTDELFWLSQSPMTSLMWIRKAAPLMGVENRELVQSLLTPLLEHVYFTNEKDIDFLGEVAKDLGVTPKEIFQQLGEDRQGKIVESIDSYYAMQWLGTLTKVADLLGEDRKDFLEKHVPLAKLELYHDKFLEEIDFLAKEMGMTRFEIFKKVMDESDSDMFSSIKYSIGHNLELVQFINDYIKWGFDNFDEPVEKQKMAYVARCLAIGLKMSENQLDRLVNVDEDFKPRFFEIKRKCTTDLDSLMDNADPIIKYLIAEGLVDVSAFRPARLQDLYELNKIENFDIDLTETMKLIDSTERVYSGSAERLFCDALAGIDPTVKKVFEDPRQLGKLRFNIMRNLSAFISDQLQKSDGYDSEQFQTAVLNKLREFVRIFSSSDTTIIEKRALFLDMFGLKDIDDPELQSQLQEISDPIEQQQKIRELVLAEFQDILLESGCDNYRNYLESGLRRQDLPGDERSSINEKLARMEQALSEADKRNRELYERTKNLQQGAEDYVESIIPRETSVSQVGPEDVTLSILDSGTLCDGLLGSEGEAQEHNLEVHIAETRNIEPNTRISPTLLSSRLPSYGNPHGLEVNRVYGDISHMRHKPHGNSYGSGYTMGSAHRCMFVGIPSTEITAIVINSDRYDLQEKAVATKGFFIPIYNSYGEEVWTPEEFDEMKTFYYTLNARGYEQGVIDNVYSYYGELRATDPDSKKWFVMSKAVEQIKGSANPASGVDLVVLTGFLKNNDLNGHPIEWYRESDFDEIFGDIKKTASSKSRMRLRGLIFDYPDNSTPGNIAGGLEGIKNVALHAGSKIEHLLGDEMKMAYGDSDAEPKARLQLNLAKTIFRGASTEQSEMPIDLSTIEKTAEDITELRRKILANAWEKAWKNISSSEEIPEEKLVVYKRKLSLVMTGSLARQESSFDSDLDFNILLDDLQPGQGETDSSDNPELRTFVEHDLLPEFSDILDSSFLHIDAGKMKEAKTPISTLSSIRDFEINFAQRRQDEEPTAILSFQPVTNDGTDLSGKAKRILFDNPSTGLLEPFIKRDLEEGSENKQSYISMFETMIVEFTAGNDISHIKEALQRTLGFKLQILLVRGVQEEKISKEKTADIPSSTLGLIDFLSTNGILDAEEASRCQELWAITYKLRLLRDVFEENNRGSSAESQSFKVDDISYDEREKFYQLIDFFRRKILYK